MARGEFTKQEEEEKAAEGWLACQADMDEVNYRLAEEKDANPPAARQLEVVAEKLLGTDRSISDVLTEIVVEANAFEVERELRQRWNFAICGDCGLWSDHIWDGLCELCRV